MKKRNFLMMAAVMLAMTLTACGGKPAEESKPVESQPEQSQPVESQPAGSEEASQPASSQQEQSQPASSKPAESSQQGGGQSSEAPATKAVAITEVGLAAKESKVYLQLSGTAENYTAAEFKWALALQHAGAAGAGDGGTTFVLGTTAEFVDADYTLPATLNPDGTFLFEYNLSDVPSMEAGLLTIHAGVKGLAENLAVGTENNGATLKDGSFRFYIRADVNSQNTIAVDELPPVAFTEASVVMDESGKAWGKIGGLAGEGVTQAMLDSYDSFVQFQQVGGSWTNTRRYKAGTYTITVGGGWGQQSHEEELVVDEDQYYWKLEGTKAYLYADISFFAAGSNYNTHLNARHPNQADLKMEVALDETFRMTNAEGADLDVNIVAVPGASQQADFWGNLGWKVTRHVEPVAPEHNLQPVEHTVGEGESEVTIQKCADDDYYEVAWNAQAATASSGFDTNGKLSGNDSGYVEYKVYSPVAQKVRLFSKMSYNTNSQYKRSDGTGDQSIWHDYKESEAGDKYIIKVNNAEIDQSTQTYKIGEEDVAIAELMYADFGDAAPIEAAWVEFNVNAGINTINIMRHTGYAVNFQTFTLKTVLAA